MNAHTDGDERDPGGSRAVRALRVLKLLLTVLLLALTLYRGLAGAPV
ncbi:MAG: hypothetical protein ABEH83_10180 [Halobacterium sp.]